MIIRILSIEALKAKKIWIPLLVLLGPVGVIGLTGINISLRYDSLFQSDKDPWILLVMNVHFLLVPTLLLGITLITSILVGMEHKDMGWKHLLTLPINRMQLYISKFIFLAALIGIASLLTSGGMVLLGILFDFDGMIPWNLILGESFLPYLASFSAMAMQLWISTVVSNQAYSMIIGIFGTIGATFMTTSPKAYWLPWVYPAFSAPLEEKSMAPDIWVPIGIIVGLCILVIGAVHFSKRDIH